MSAPPGRDRTTGADMRPKRRGSNARGSGAVRVAITARGWRAVTATDGGTESMRLPEPGSTVIR